MVEYEYKSDWKLICGTKSQDYALGYARATKEKGGKKDLYEVVLDDGNVLIITERDYRLDWNIVINEGVSIAMKASLEKWITNYHLSMGR